MHKPPNVTLNVTREIIDHSTPQNSGSCMVAQAIRLQVPGARSVDVTAETLKFNLDETRFAWPTPAEVSVRVTRYDELCEQYGVEVARAMTDPFSFRLYGSSGFSRPVFRRGPRTSPIAKHKPHEPARKCARRYMGLKIVTLTKEQL